MGEGKVSRREGRSGDGSGAMMEGRKRQRRSERKQLDDLG